MTNEQRPVEEAKAQDRIDMARIELLSYHVKRGLLFPGMDERNNELHGLIDALIAAVSADLKGQIDAHIEHKAALLAQLADLKNENTTLRAKVDACEMMGTSGNVVILSHEGKIEMLSRRVNELQETLQAQVGLRELAENVAENAMAECADLKGEIERVRKAFADHVIQCPQCHDVALSVLASRDEKNEDHGAANSASSQKEQEHD